MMAMINNKRVEIDAAIVRLRKTILHECDLFYIYLPRFCYHDELSIAGNCRMCLVETNTSAKPVIACATVFSSKLEIFTDSNLIRIARENVLEFLLINHPLDCPICDQGGECDLQDQAVVFGSDRGRFSESKRSVEDKEFSLLIKAIMTRCIHCTRCIRYSDEIMDAPLLGTLGRGMLTEIGTFVSEMFNSRIVGNMADICPVGALTFSAVAYTSRAWELIGIDTIDALDGMCSSIRIDVRGNTIIRILPRLNPRVNGEWITDDIRTSYELMLADRLCFPMYRESQRSPFRRCSWQRALHIVSTHVGIELKAQSKFSFFVGNGADLYSTSMFKYLACVTALDNISSNLSFVVDDRTEFILDLSYVEDNNVQLFFMIGVNPRTESPILNIKLTRVFGTPRALQIREQGGLLFTGTGLILNYKLQHINLGASLADYVLKGNRFYCTDVKFGEDCYYLKGESLSFFSATVNKATYYAYKLLEKKGIRINFLSKASTTVGLFEDANGALNRSKTMFWPEDAQLIFSSTCRPPHNGGNGRHTYFLGKLGKTFVFGSSQSNSHPSAVSEGCIFVLAAQYFRKSKGLGDSTSSMAKIRDYNYKSLAVGVPYEFISEELSGKRFCVYIGPYSYLAETSGANVVLPSNSFIEKPGSYLNVIGLIQKTVRVIRLPVHLWSDEWIVMTIALFLSLYHPTAFCRNVILRIFNRIKHQQLRYRKLPEQMPLPLLNKYYMVRRSFGLPERHSYCSRYAGDPLWPRRLDQEILRSAARKKDPFFGELDAYLTYRAYEMEVYHIYRQWKYPDDVKRSRKDPMAVIVGKILWKDEAEKQQHLRYILTGTRTTPSNTSVDTSANTLANTPGQFSTDPVNE